MPISDLVRKVSELPPDQQTEVEFFVDRLSKRGKAENEAPILSIEAYAELFAGTEFDLIERVSESE